MMWPYDAILAALAILAAGVFLGWMLCGWYARRTLQEVTVKVDGSTFTTGQVREFCEKLSQAMLGGEDGERIAGPPFDPLGGYSGPTLAREPSAPCGDIMNPHSIVFRDERGECTKCGAKLFGNGEHGNQT
jgi:hypothetical protein